jgi:cytidyltransferase-like protein
LTIISSEPGGKNEYALTEELTRLKADLALARGRGLSVDELKTEHNFTKYVKLLKSFAGRYTVLIAAEDTPCGPSFTPEIAAELTAIGLKINLAGMFRRSYAAIVDAGELVFERAAPSVTESVEHECAVGGVPVKLESVCFNVPKNNAARIMIGGRHYSPGGRGLNFVVFDMVAKTLLDAVSFDTYSDRFPCRRPRDLAEGLLRYQNTHPGVSLLCFNLPRFPDADLSDNEKFILQFAVGRANILQNLDKPIFALNKYFTSPEEISEVLRAPKSYLGVNGVRQFEDTRGRRVNTSGGHRVTTDQPKNYGRTVYLVGGCQIFGVGASDEGTVASHLQRLFNDLAPEQEAVVQNYGFYLAEAGDAQTGEELAILNALPAKAGDVILCDFGINPEIPHVDMAEAARRPHHYGEVFFDTMHRTEDGNRMIADKLFAGLERENFFAEGLNSDARKALAEYKKILTDFYNSMFGITIGAVVMNCNPFTMGHRYLIEQAAAQVDHLIIFVVQEDKSVFPFDERLRLVDEGVSDLKNVTVIPSGRFIISSLTFSGYFNKAETQDRAVDSSLDVALFAREIAPCLNISARFAGEEPFDAVTRRYNDTMRAVLPQYGIRFIEIPRKEIAGEAISASRVRKLLETRDFAEIAKIVPRATLEYLMRRQR